MGNTRIMDTLRKLKKMRYRLLVLRKRAETFGEEVTLNHIIYSIDEAVKAYGTDG